MGNKIVVNGLEFDNVDEAKKFCEVNLRLLKMIKEEIEKQEEDNDKINSGFISVDANMVRALLDGKITLEDIFCREEKDKEDTFGNIEKKNCILLDSIVKEGNCIKLKDLPKVDVNYENASSCFLGNIVNDILHGLSVKESIGLEPLRNGTYIGNGIYTVEYKGNDVYVCYAKSMGYFLATFDRLREIGNLGM